MIKSALRKKKSKKNKKVRKTLGSTSFFCLSFDVKNNNSQEMCLCPAAWIKQSCQFFVWLVPQVQSSLVHRLIQAYLSPTSHFALVSFQSHLFLLHLLLSSLIPSPFLLLLSNLCSPTVSFPSSAPHRPCPPLRCHSASILKANWKKGNEDPHALKLWRLLLQC